MNIPVPVVILKATGKNHILSYGYGPVVKGEIQFEIIEEIYIVRPADVLVEQVRILCSEPMVGYCPRKMF